MKTRQSINLVFRESLQNKHKTMLGQSAWWFLQLSLEFKLLNDV